MAVRRKLIQTVVADLLQRHGVQGPPVDVMKIARGLGARVGRAPAGDPDLSGFLLRQPEPGGVIIGVNGSHPAVRQRFTIAHEIGHLLLHRGEGFHVDRGAFRVFKRDSDSATGTNPAEIEANVFAAELLMPAKFLIADVRKRTSIDLADDTSLRDLAARYKVSPQAMAFRLANLGQIQL